MPGFLAGADLRALMAVVEEGRRDDPSVDMPWAVLDGLAELIGCDSVTFHDFDVPSHSSCRRQESAGGEHAMELDFEDSEHLELYRDFLPSTYYARTGDLPTVIRWSDFYSMAELRAQPLFAEAYAPDGCRHLMMAALAETPQRARRIALWRDSGRDFGERERLALQLLRPHLNEVYLDARRRRAKVPRLTRREYEVLRLAAQGLGNADIARELFISVSTVRKHLEHIYDRTGVRTRAAAAALVLPHL